ncbi:hypothetical protein PFISCL1PPCAC_6298, partial [Pristionchus fissidentatus]
SMALLSKPLTKGQLTPALLGIGGFILILRLYRTRAARAGLSRATPIVTKKGVKTKLDITFFKKLFSIVRILVPKILCKQTLYMFLIAVSLLCRTYADVWMITTSTKIEASIIDRDKDEFKSGVIGYVLCTPAISLVNAMLKFSLSELKVLFRDSLTRHLYSEYFKNMTFYKLGNMDNRIANADQLLTQDVDKFCDALVELYANVTKPLVDLALYIFRLGSALGFKSPSGLVLYLVLSGVALTYLRAPMGRLTAKEQQLEGEFRYVNSRLIANAEEVAFYKGEDKERITSLSSFDTLIQHLRTTIKFRFSVGFVDNIIAKYLATVVGWYTVSRPFFSRNGVNPNKTKSELMQDYYNSGRMMFKMAEALGRLALAGREATRLAGFTLRVDTFRKVLDDVSKGKYQRSIVNESKESRSLAENLLNQRGKFIANDDLIRFEGVPLLTPNGDVLIRSLDFEVPAGRNVIVCGPNGCGKSSLFRVLGELWPLYGGTLTKPIAGKLFYVPQRPYMPLGSLRDQVIYPDSVFQARKKGFTDEKLVELLHHVQLDYVLDREGGWEAVHDWIDVLSGGEKQRIAMARLFYHRPRYAILDECTSAVSVDVEGAMYSLCRQLNITLFTVSHRKSLWAHHEYSLFMDGRGNYEFTPIDAETQAFGS